MTIHSIVKDAIEKYTGFPVEINTHVQITVMWRLTEVIEYGETELFNDLIIEGYNKDLDVDKKDLIEICELIVEEFTAFLEVKGCAASDKNKFKVKQKNKINEENGTNN